MEDVSGLLLELAELYKTNRQAQEATDSIYGKGATEFWGRALETFCTNQTAAQKLKQNETKIRGLNSKHKKGGNTVSTSIPAS